MKMSINEMVLTALAIARTDGWEYTNHSKGDSSYKAVRFVTDDDVRVTVKFFRYRRINNDGTVYRGVAPVGRYVISEYSIDEGIYGTKFCDITVEY